MEITEIIHLAIEKMRKSFGGTKVELLSAELERIDQSTIGGYQSILGAYVKIEGVKTFLHYRYAEDISITPDGYGQKLADELVFNVLKTAHPEMVSTTRLED